VRRVSEFEIAQLNVGRLVAPREDPLVKEFMDALDPINALAEASPGFVWRFQTDEGNATAYLHFADDDLLINLSTWRSIDALHEFVYRSDHTPYVRRRREWFQAMDEVIAVLWWVPVGHRPSPAEALERLELLRTNGPSAEAFTFRQRFDPPAG
jgi:hypothetical protein